MGVNRCWWSASSIDALQDTISAWPIGFTSDKRKAGARKEPICEAGPRRCRSNRFGFTPWVRTSVGSFVLRRKGPEFSWIETEFETVQLGDARRPRRLKKVIQAMWQNPGASQRGSAGSWAAAMGSYRLW